MKSLLFRCLAAAALFVGCLSLGCGPSTTTPDPDKVQSQGDYQAEMAKQEGALMGDRPAPPVSPPPAAKPEEKTEPEPEAEAKTTP